MKLNADCIFCIIDKQRQLLKESSDEDTNAKYMTDVLRAIANAGENATAPRVVADISLLHQEYFGSPFSYDALKREYNELLLQREDEIGQRIEKSADPLLAAVKFARAGNYIDSGAMNQIENEKLDHLLNTAGQEEISRAEYAAFLKDLNSARRLMYLTDNCGEIVLDKLLIREIRKRYPKLHVTVIVRGKPVLNDATAEDAAFVGLQEEAEVLGNGTGIAGTQLDAISEEAKSRILGADLIISKGQGNFETLHGCGLNVYYLFLCKCELFVRRFQLERYKGVFINERNCKIAGG